MAERMMAVYPGMRAVADPCPGCGGHGTRNVEPHEMETEIPDWIVLVPVFCEECRGCGSADHTECAPEDHYDHRPVGTGCKTCGGRRWRVAELLRPEGPTECPPAHGKMPCECAGALLRIVE